MQNIETAFTRRNLLPQSRFEFKCKCGNSNFLTIFATWFADSVMRFYIGWENLFYLKLWHESATWNCRTYNCWLIVIRIFNNHCQIGKEINYNDASFGNVRRMFKYGKYLKPRHLTNYIISSKYLKLYQRQKMKTKNLTKFLGSEDNYIKRRTSVMWTRVTEILTTAHSNVATSLWLYQVHLFHTENFSQMFKREARCRCKSAQTDWVKIMKD